MWGYDFSLKKIGEGERYVVFQSEDYVYLGGAHGGVTGKGCLTFDKENGSYAEHIVDRSSRFC